MHLHAHGWKSDYPTSAHGKQFLNVLTGTKSFPPAQTGMAAYTVVKEITVK